MSAAVLQIPIEQIHPDPDQPRKVFDETALRELASSIRENGLLQPIRVRQIGPLRYNIVFGERRWRAHKLLKAATVPAMVVEPADNAALRIAQIIENDQRQDVTPLEQARSYQSLMDAEGWTPEQLGQRLGKSAFRISERTSLLRLSAEYQQLLASGNLKPSEAYEMSRLNERGQAALFKAIKAGQCRTFNDLRASANALLEAQAQLSLMDDAGPPPPSDDEKREATAFEAKVEQIAAMLRAGIRDNHVEAVRKVNPNRASHLADLLAAMQADIRRIEVALRQSAVQASLFAMEA
jgi:ParB family chromosome partitioning protein